MHYSKEAEPTKNDQNTHDCDEEKKTQILFWFFILLKIWRMDLGVYYSLIYLHIYNSMEAKETKKYRENNKTNGNRKKWTCIVQIAFEHTTFWDCLCVSLFCCFSSVILFFFLALVVCALVYRIEKPKRKSYTHPWLPSSWMSAFCL